MDLPSTGWVTALAGFLARGSLLSCVRPSQFTSGRVDAGSPLTVAGAATNRCAFNKSEYAVLVFPLSSPERPGEPARVKCSLYCAHESSAAGFTRQRLLVTQLSAYLEPLSRRSSPSPA